MLMRLILSSPVYIDGISLKPHYTTPAGPVSTGDQLACCTSRPLTPRSLLNRHFNHL